MCDVACVFDGYVLMKILLLWCVSSLPRVFAHASLNDKSEEHSYIPYYIGTFACI